MVLAVFASVATAYGLFLVQDANVKRSLAAVEHTYDVIVALELVLDDVADIETGERGLLLTGDTAYLEPYRRGVAAIRENMARVLDLAAAETAQNARMANLEALLQDRVAAVSRIVEMFGQGDREQAFALDKSTSGVNLMREVREAVAAAEAEARELLSIRRADSERERNRWSNILSGALVAAVVAIAVFGFVIARLSRQNRIASQKAAAERQRLLDRLDLAAIFVRDADGTVRFWSAGCEALYGFTADEALGKSAHALLRTVFMTPLREIEGALLRDGTWSGELGHRTKAGRELVVIAHMVMRHQEDGGPVVVESVTDMSPLRRAERALAESEQRLRLALDAAELGTWSWDPTDGTDALEWDVRCKALFGMPPDAAVNYRAWASTIHPEDLPSAEALVSRAINPADPNDDFNFDYRVLLQDGTIRWLSISGRATFEPDTTPTGGRRALRFIGVARDVTQARRFNERRVGREMRNRFLIGLEARLRQATTARDAVVGACAMLGQHFGAGVVGLSEVEPDGSYAVAKNEWQAEGKPSLLGRHALDPARIAPLLVGKIIALEDVEVEQHDTAARDFYRALGIRSLMDVPLIREGRLRAILYIADVKARAWTVTELALARETLNRTWETAERARAEERLLELNQELEQRVRTAVQAREEAQAVAAHSQRIQALGQLAGGIAHDFNNILQSVSGAARLIDLRADTEPRKVKQLSQLIIDASVRGTSITRRLLSFARRGDLHSEVIDVARLLRDIREVLAHTLSTTIRVRVTHPELVPDLVADRGQLETALINLGSNARDAMPQGGTLTLSAGAETVGSGTRHPGNLPPGAYVRLTVADTGTGMDAVTLARAAEPFFTTKQQGQGTGLGLPMVKGFAEQSGGAMSVASNPGQGTSVTIWLPQATGVELIAPQQEVEPTTTDVSAHVLLVDDEDMVREVLAEGLDNLGFATLTASSGAEALALLDAGERVDALVSDLSMPEMDGLTTIRLARGRKPGMPCFLLTGYVGERAALSANGEFTLVRKPISSEALAAQIEAGIRSSRD